MTTYIALTALESHWKEPENTRLLTDACCLHDGGNAWEKYGEPVDTERFHDPEVFEAAYHYCNELTDKAMPLVAQALEKEFGLGMDERFYERIVYPWLLQFTQALYDRYTSITRAVERVPNACFLTAQMHGPLYPSKDAICFNLSISRDDAYNLFLYSDIIVFLKLPQKASPLRPIEAMMPVFGETSPSWKQRLLLPLLTVQTRLRSLCGKPVHLMHDCSGVSSFKTILRLWKGKCLPYTPFVSLPSISINETLRSQQLNLGVADFERLLGAFILRYIPFGMCEALPALVRWAQKHPACKSRGVLATSIGLYTDIPLMVLAGVSNRPLAILEHGGIEMLRNNFHGKIQTRVAERYFSQGFATQYSLPSPYLFEKKTAQVCSAPLLVANDGYRFLPRFMPIFCEGSMQPYHAARISFLSALATHKFPTLRLYFLEFGWGVKKGLQERFSCLNFQDANYVPMSQAMANTCLLVLDHYSTTVHRAMATNIPTIIFLRKGISSQLAEGLIQQMRKAKIWHDTPESAAAFYNTLIPNGITSWAQAKPHIDAWWLSEKTQRVREAFCEKYARTSSNWAKEWAQAFDQMSD